VCILGGACQQALEPGGTLVDDVSIVDGHNGTVRVAYVTKPTMLTIHEENRVFILRMIETEKI
jgi:hypothetical protein